MTDDTYQIAAEGAIAVDDTNGVPRAALEAALANFAIPLNFATPLSRHSETSGDYVGYGSRTWVSDRSKAIAFFVWAVVFVASASCAKVFATTSAECWRSLGNDTQYDDDDDPGGCPAWEFAATFQVAMTIIFGSYGLVLYKNPSACLKMTFQAMFREFEQVWKLHDGLASGDKGLFLAPDGIMVTSRHDPVKKLDKILNIKSLTRFVRERRARGLRVPDWSAVLSSLYPSEPRYIARQTPILSKRSVALFLAGMIKHQAPKDEDGNIAADATYGVAITNVMGCVFIFDRLIEEVKNSARSDRADLVVVAAHLFQLFLVRGEASVDCCYRLLEKFMEARRPLYEERRRPLIEDLFAKSRLGRRLDKERRRALLEDLLAESRRGRRLGTLFDSDATLASRGGDADHVVVAIPPLSLNSDAADERTLCSQRRARVVSGGFPTRR